MVYILSQWFFLAIGFFGSVTTDEHKVPEKNLHPFYVSVTEINQNLPEKTLEVSCKFFADDFEHTLEKAYKSQLDITSDKEKASFDNLIPDYVSKHLKISVDGKPVKLSYVGYEKDKESVYCYFEVQNTLSLKRLDITNDLLYDLTHEQINIIHVNVNAKRQSSKLNYPEAKAGYQF